LKPLATAGKRDVFLNCPFDKGYDNLFEAIMFSVHDAGFRLRCAWEFDDAAQGRLDKIVNLIEQCPFGIHDLSRMALDTATGLPRFNMPLELGISHGLRHRSRQPILLVLDEQPTRYRDSCSDLAGFDIKVHAGNEEKVIECVRDWLRNQLGSGSSIPSAERMIRRWQAYRTDKEKICDELELDTQTRNFFDRQNIVFTWLKANPPSKRIPVAG